MLIPHNWHDKISLKIHSFIPCKMYLSYQNPLLVFLYFILYAKIESQLKEKSEFIMVHRCYFLFNINTVAKKNFHPWSMTINIQIRHTLLFWKFYITNSRPCLTGRYEVWQITKLILLKIYRH